MINSGWRGEYYLQQDLEGRRKLLKRLVGSLHLEPATRQRIRHFDMERIPDRYKLDPDLWETAEITDDTDPDAWEAIYADS